ncbi:MAG: ATP-binding cassette domain-containing protein [bacterium]
MIVRGLSAHVGSFALHDVSFELPTGAWGIVLGPTGSGKTTLLETIAGVRRARSGTISLRGRDVTADPADVRRVGIVYQHSYLFPHLTVEENVRYGTNDHDGARDVANRLGVHLLRDRPVSALSGGERQVVALARALAPQPDILLLDEPFAALDPRRRTLVRRELRLLQRERGMTVLHVTHDFVEAGTLGDLALVLEGGRLSQVGSPTTIFRHPASGSVAEFLGAENIFAGTIARSSVGDGEATVMTFEGEGLALVGVGELGPGAGHAVIRASEVVLARASSGPTSARNVLHGIIDEIAADGMLARVTVRVGAVLLVAIVTQGSAHELGLVSGIPVIASIKATAVHLC